MIIRDIDAIGYTFRGDNLCRYCTRDVLEQIVYTNAYLLPGEADGLGIFNLMRVCDGFQDGTPMTTATEAYNTEAFDSNDFPKAFEEVEFQDERCTNPECEQKLMLVYYETVNR